MCTFFIYKLNCTVGEHNTGILHRFLLSRSKVKGRYAHFSLTYMTVKDTLPC